VIDMSQWLIDTFLADLAAAFVGAAILVSTIQLIRVFKRWIT
jgi:hypothetical protein